jgi:transcriptional regulator with XRE-family HTH domain
MTISEKLLKYRTELKMTQQEVADRLGISQGTYNHWESDKARIVIEHIPKLSEIFGKPATEFIPEGMVVKIVTNQDNKDDSINGFEIKLDAKKLYKDLDDSKNEIIASQRETIIAKDETIAAQKATITTQQTQIERLLAEVERLKQG